MLTALNHFIHQEVVDNDNYDAGPWKSAGKMNQRPAIMSIPMNRYRLLFAKVSTIMIDCPDFESH